MPRHKENKVRLQCRMDAGKKAELDRRLLDAGYSYKSGGTLYPTYADFLEGLVDGDSKALKIIFDKVLDNLE